MERLSWRRWRGGVTAEARMSRDCREDAGGEVELTDAVVMGVGDVEVV